MTILIGSHKAKTKLPELLRKVKTGQSFTITKHGRAVADLVPCVSAKNKDRAAAADKLKAFMLAQPVRSANIKALDYRTIITSNPEILAGKPCVRGMRISVYDILDYLASGMTTDEILADFPDLTREDIHACLAFAADRERQLLSIPT